MNLLKTATTLVVLVALSACNKASFGDREAALEYLRNNRPGEVEKPLIHNFSYFKVWCAEDDKKYWPEAVKFCAPTKDTLSENLCSFVNIAEKARTEGNAGCDPT